MHASPRRRPRPARIWTALAVAVAAAVTVAALQLNDGSCAAAADPRAGDGTALYHRDWTTVQCSTGPLPPGGDYVSVSTTEFEGSALCGASLDITGPEGRVRALVVDRCRACGPGRLDLSERAFARVAGGTSRGVAPVSYRLVRDPEPASRLAFRVKHTSTREWLALLVTGHGNPLSRVELRRADGWRPLRRGPDNLWSITAPGPGPYRVRVTDRHGNSAQVANLRLAPGAAQTTRQRLYTTSAAAGPTAVTPSAGPVETTRPVARCP
ncbi:expansin EXLX1 family cellulose-binding protein [Spirillospora sp. CA-294931]|uniref:expansin EXLX1 family cellulose-binding protein n=1 Tax=Spirillospora sp. CA-294931 TaxID=3240042 RepID=UPI003D90953E